MKVKAISPINRDGETYQPGDSLDVSKETVQELIAAGAVADPNAPKEEPTDEDHSAEEVLADANDQAATILSDARTEAEKIKAEAKQDADKTVSDARTEAEKIKAEAKPASK